MSALFYIASVVAILSTILVITELNAVHALLYLIASLLSVAVIFFVLGAPFVGALEVIIYAGAIMVLFVFVVMMLNLGRPAAERESTWLRPRMFVLPGLVGAGLVIELIYVLFSAGGGATTAGVITPKEFGVALFGPYLAGVEIAAMLLLAGLIGAYHLGRRDREGES